MSIDPPKSGLRPSQNLSTALFSDVTHNQCGRNDLGTGSPWTLSIPFSGNLGQIWVNYLPKTLQNPKL